MERNIEVLRRASAPARAVASAERVVDMMSTTAPASLEHTTPLQPAIEA